MFCSCTLSFWAIRNSCLMFTFPRSDCPSRLYWPLDNWSLFWDVTYLQCVIRFNVGRVVIRFNVKTRVLYLLLYSIALKTLSHLPLNINILSAKRNYTLFWNILPIAKKSQYKLLIPSWNLTFVKSNFQLESSQNTLLLSYVGCGTLLKITKFSYFCGIKHSHIEYICKLEYTVH